MKIKNGDGNMEQLLEWMEIIEDVRQHRKVRHSIKDILIIVLFAMLANAECRFCTVERVVSEKVHRIKKRNSVQ